jgi:hypothetical protein
MEENSIFMAAILDFLRNPRWRLSGTMANGMIEILNLENMGVAGGIDFLAGFVIEI